VVPEYGYIITAVNVDRHELSEINYEFYILSGSLAIGRDGSYRKKKGEPITILEPKGYYSKTKKNKSK